VDMLSFGVLTLKGRKQAFQTPLSGSFTLALLPRCIDP